MSSIDHSQYLIHQEKVQECLNCKLDTCVYDLPNSGGVVGCEIEAARGPTGTQVMALKHDKKRAEAFEKINAFIAQGKSLNLKQAAGLTGLSTAVMSRYMKRGLLKVEPARRGYRIIEAINE